jgi:antitoxin component of RelBE/YafQ-DinJ toxin-antitoxin module
MAEEEILDIRIRLRGEVKDRFRAIKRAKGLTNNTEVVRLIINEYFERNLARLEGASEA